MRRRNGIGRIIDNAAWMALGALARWVHERSLDDAEREHERRHQEYLRWVERSLDNFIADHLRGCRTPRTTADVALTACCRMSASRERVEESLRRLHIARRIKMDGLGWVVGGES